MQARYNKKVVFSLAKRRDAFSQGNEEAQSILQRSYGVGGGAVYWYKKAAEQGDAKAQYNLAECYSLGKGVSKDYTQAVYWYRRSAKHGFAAACYKLAELSKFGLCGLSEDLNTALYWYEKAAKNKKDGSLHVIDEITVDDTVEKLKSQGYSSSRAKLD